MALQVHVAGPALVRVDYGIGLRDLGYSANGVDITSTPYFLDVPGDEKGGDNGPPIESQIFGYTAEVRLDLTKYDQETAEILEARFANLTMANPPVPGSLLRGSGGSIRLLIHSANQPRNFPAAVARGAIQVNKGTRHSRFLIDFTCYDWLGVLWNTVTS